MDKVTAAAKQANGRSRACNKCPVLKSNKACPEMYLNVCTQAFVDGFKKGAKWQINHVWHNADEIPDLSKSILIMYANGDCAVFNGGVHTLHELKVCDYIKWAYIDDLLPIKN